MHSYPTPRDASTVALTWHNATSRFHLEWWSDDLEPGEWYCVKLDLAPGAREGALRLLDALYELATTADATNADDVAG